MALHLTKEKDLEKIAKSLSAVVQPGDVLLLEGEIGAGKTTFMRYLARALNINSPITSPTFTLVQDYDGTLPISHIDLYRLDNEEALMSMDIQRYLTQHERFVCIEWAEKLGDYHPVNFVKLSFSYVDGSEGVSEERLVDCTVSGETYQRYNAAWKKI